MQESVLNKLKQFESILKKCLQARFGNNLPQDKVTLLNNTEFVNAEELQGLTNRNDIQGAILRKMLNSIINLSTNKTFNLENNQNVTLEYGKDIQSGIVEYYAKEISSKYKFDINELPGLLSDIELVKVIKERLEERLDKEIFNKTAIELLNIEGLAEFAKKYDKDLIDKYIKDNNIVFEKEIPQNKNPLDDFNQINGSLEIINIGDQKYLKFTDLTQEEHLIKITDDKEVLDLYKSKVSALTPGEKINPEEFFSDLKNIINKRQIKEESLTLQEEKLPDEINILEQSTKNILSMANKGVKPNSPIKAVPLEIDSEKKPTPIKAVPLEIKSEEIKEDILPLEPPHLEEEKISNDTIKNESDELSFTEALNTKKVDDEESKISDTISLGAKDLFNDVLNQSEVINNNTGSSLLDEAVTDTSAENNNSSGILTAEKYEELCMKYARGEELTQEEYYSLLKSTPDLMTEEEIQLLEKTGKQLTPTLATSNGQSLGFGSKNMIFYLTLVTVVIGLIFGAILFKLTS